MLTFSVGLGTGYITAVPITTVVDGVTHVSTAYATVTGGGASGPGGSGGEGSGGGGTGKHKATEVQASQFSLIVRRTWQRRRNR